MSDNKVYLITGATSGIGKAAVLSLARQGTSIVMVSRNKEKGESVRAAIAENTRNEIIHLAVADLSSQQDIRKLASDIKSQYSKLDILVNNAGGIFDKKEIRSSRISYDRDVAKRLWEASAQMAGLEFH
ncbi:MAG: SDR family NAD(P)-dependent oxidoreductase [Ignavibacteria bacterium]|nr:SDR family NAD(P)-dependent oxidoreductase [Ignavibacteria bacterium]